MIGGPQQHMQAGVPPQSPSTSMANDDIGKLIAATGPQNSGAADYLNKREQQFQVDQQVAQGADPTIAAQREAQRADSVRGQHPFTSPGARNKNEPAKDWYSQLINRSTI